MRKHLRLSLGKTFEDDSAIKTLNVGESIEVTATVDVENVNFCQIMIDFDQKILDLISKNKLFKFEGGSYIKDISFILKASKSIFKDDSFSSLPERNKTWVSIEAKADGLIQSSGFYIEVISKKHFIN